MGTWGFGPFENDEALDWLSQLKEEPDWLAFLENTLRTVDVTGGLDADDDAKAIAAAEVVAAIFGSPHNRFDRDLLMTFQIPSPPAYLKELASKVATQIRGQSELRSLWDEAEPAHWLSEMDDLRKRLLKS